MTDLIVNYMQVKVNMALQQAAALVSPKDDQYGAHQGAHMAQAAHNVYTSNIRLYIIVKLYYNILL